MNTLLCLFVAGVPVILERIRFDNSVWHPNLSGDSRLNDVVSEKILKRSRLFACATVAPNLLNLINRNLMYIYDVKFIHTLVELQSVVQKVIDIVPIDW